MKALKDPDAPSSGGDADRQRLAAECRGGIGVVRANVSRGLRVTTLLRALTEENVLLQLQHLRTHPGVAAGLATGKIRLHGWIYNIGDGRVDAS